MSEPKFKFELGDIVRHVTYRHNSLLMQEEMLTAVITARAWYEEPDDISYPIYAIESVGAHNMFILESTLELVERSTRAS